jgi:hypothetical protein
MEGFKELAYPINPFTTDYYNQEKDWFISRCSQIKNNRITIKYKTINGRIDGYLYRDLVYIENVPVFQIDGKTWMSITPMEVESHYIPIFCAQGRVGVAGLGLGYYVQRILDKPEVDEVDVYEIDQDVINTYLQIFGTHPKLTIIKGDVLKLCKNQDFDWFYNDIYQFRFDDKAFEDMTILEGNNIIADYHFWTLEAFILSAIQNGKSVNKIIPYMWKMRYYPFIQTLLEEKQGLVEDYLNTDESIQLIENYVNSIKEWK